MEKNPGDRIGRFVIERVAGVGGMGRVYRAKDPSGAVVAIKVLHDAYGDATERFEREVRMLKQIEHPNIVRYVDDGKDEDGAPWLAMEWVDGDALSNVIARNGALPFEIVVRVGAQVARALAAAHVHGILHRDIKPHNLIVLPDGNVKVLDFGIARRSKETISLTRTGMVVGSFHYMSPEQALGNAALTPASDVFSLGCVLYELLTGKRPFFAHDATAVLAKILLDDPIPIVELRPSVPIDLADIVDRMLAKDASDRPAGGDALARALEMIDLAIVAPPPPAHSAIGATEQRVVCLVLAKDPSNDTLVALPSIAPPPNDDALELLARANEGRLVVLADGCTIVTFEGRLLTDAVPRAARCALELRRMMPKRAVVLALGLGVVAERAPIGSVIDVAVRAAEHPPEQGVRLAGAFEGLLDERFEISEDVLVREKGASFGARRLLGRETTCVGRDREARTLEALWTEATEEKSARVALVTGGAGLGKSRLLHELLRRIDPASVLVGRGDTMGAGSPFSVLSEAIRAAAGATRALAMDAQSAALDAHASMLGLDAHTRMFLAELCGIYVADPSDALRAARGDARAMGDAMRRAFEDWLAARVAKAPVLFVLEDLHWGDLPSVRFLDSALRNLAHLPFMVLALARPEVDERFPGLWKDHAVLRLALGPLSKRAQEKLVREVLPDVSEEAIERITERSEGNAFFLEELIRSEREGQQKAVPKSVLAMVQARLDAVDPDARRVLRAASIFGDRFTRDGISALARDVNVDGSLATLVTREIINPQGLAFVFRHALVRETAYALLTEDDRKLGHVLAGEWLASQGERDPVLLATHFERGGQPERASGWLLRAAHQALDGADLAKVLELAGRALASATDAETKGRLRYVQAEAHRWRGEMQEAIACAHDATHLLDPGSLHFYLALGEAIAACAFSGNFSGAGPYFDRALRTPPTSSAVSARIVSIARGCTQMLEAGRYEEVDAIMRELELGDLDALEDVARGWVGWLHAMRALCAGDLGAFIEVTEKTLAVFEKLAETRHVCSQRTNLGYAYAELGDYSRAETQLRHVAQDAERLGLPMLVAYSLHNLGVVIASQGRIDEGLALEQRAVDVAASMKDPRIEGASRAYVAKMALEKNDLEVAARESELAIGLLREHPALLAFAIAVRGLVHLARSDLDHALEHTTRATDILEQHGAFEDGETAVRLAHVRVLLARGDRDGARDAASAAKARLLARAARIGAPAWRTTFLQNVKDSRETLAIAEACGV